MKIRLAMMLIPLLSAMSLLAGPVLAQEPVNFVVQLTKNNDNYGQRKALLQIDRTIHDLGKDHVRFTVVAYDEGISALLASNKETNQLLVRLADEGVTFEACRISMKAWGYNESDFPLEVKFVPAGAPEVIRLEMKGYKYWKP